MKTALQKITAILMVLLMVTAVFSGCSKSSTESVDSIGDDLIQNAVDSDDEDVIADGSSGGGSGGNGDKSNGILNSGSGSGGGKSTSGDSVYKPEDNHEIDEEATKSFLESVPKSLKGTTVKHLIWWNPGTTEKRKAEIFKKETGIEIKWIVSGVDKHTTKLASMIGQGNSPDLAPMVMTDFPTSITNDYFQTLDAGKLNLDDKIYDLNTMNQYKWNGKYYGAMIKSSTMVTFYPVFFNKDLFKKLGVKDPYQLWQEGNWNWETLVQTCLTLKQDKGIKTPLSGDYGLNFLSNSAGADAIEYDGNGGIINNADPKNSTAYNKVLKGWQFLNTLKFEHKVLGSESYGGFYSGDVPMLLTGNYVAQRGDVFDKNVKFNWGFAPTPSPKGSNVVLPGEAKLWGFPKGAKNTEAAGYWLRYWLDSAYDPTDAPLWSDKADGLLSFTSWMWEQEKSFMNYKGIVAYGGNYTAGQMFNELSECGSNNVKTVLEKWSGVLDKNISKIKKWG